MELVFGNTEGNNRIIRDAMLEAEAHWLGEADSADSMTMRSVARIIAEAFHNEAEKYKTKETDFHDHGNTITIEPSADGNLPSLG